MDLRVLFLLFIIYSFLGWLLEIIIVSIQSKRLVDRGFLIGPVCPIYGCGALLMTFLLEKYFNDFLALFVFATIIGAVLEYFVSYLMEKIFKTRWWDYSNYKLNINGRISLTSSILFGLLGVLVIHVLNQFFIGILEMIPNIILLILSIVICIVFLTDIIVSFNVISKIKKIDLSDAKDTTEEITAKVKEVLKSRSKLSKRLVMAFPNLRVKLPIDFSKIKIKKN